MIEEDIFRLSIIFVLVCNCIAFQGGTSTRFDICRYLTDKKGEVDKSASLTLSTCRDVCSKKPSCVKTLFLPQYMCCIYYQDETVYMNACNSLASANYEGQTGCDDDAMPDPGARPKPPFPPTPSTTTTTTTTTTTPSPGAESTAVAIDMTTEADEDEEVPPPDESLKCEDEEVTGEGESWLKLRTLLREENPSIFCHQICYTRQDSTPKCFAMKDYDPLVCGAFLKLLFGRGSFYLAGVKVTVTRCEKPEPATEGPTTVSAEVTGMDATGDTSDTTGDSTGVTEGMDVTGATGVTDATVDDVTGDTTGDMTTSV